MTTMKKKLGYQVQLKSLRKLDAMKMFSLAISDSTVLDCRYLYIDGMLFLSRITKNMNIKKYFNKRLLSLNPKRMKIYALLSLETCVLKTSTDEGLIFASCECIAISRLLCLKSELQVEERDLFDCFGGNNE